MTGIYKITNLNNAKFYIGRSKHIEKRWKQHFDKSYGAEHSVEFQNDIDTYGKDGFAFEVLEECNEELLNEREKQYIAKLKPQYNTIYDGHIVSPETRAKISRKLTGRKMPDEVKAKIAAGILKRHETIPQTNAGHKKKIGCEGFDEPFESVNACAEFFGLHASTVTKALKKNRKVRGNKVWYVV